VRDPRSYVVRVYRQHARGVAGTVQEVRSGRIAPFRTMEELWQAVRSRPPASEAGPTRRRAGRTAPGEADRSEPDAGSTHYEKDD